MSTTTPLPEPAVKRPKPKRYRTLGDAKVARLDATGTERELEAVRAALRSWRDASTPMFAARQRMRDDLDRLLARGVQLGVVDEATLRDARLHDMRSQWIALVKRYGNELELQRLVAQYLLEQKGRA